MNRKADISITIFVLGVVALCFLTIFSFILVNNDRSDDFFGIGLIETMNSIDEEIKLNDFETDYNNQFESGNVKITIENGKVKEGTYTNREGKVLVKVIYEK